MIKHLRNYNKQILAGVSALLLVVFLAPTAVQQCTRMNARPSTVWAVTKDGSKLTLGEKEELRGQLAVLEALREPLSTRLNLTKSPEHWWLLVKEAKDAGLVGGPADGKGFLENFAAQSGMNANDLLGRLAGMSHQTVNAVLVTLADLRGVYRLAEMVAGPGRQSDTRMRFAARELLTDVSAEVVPIDAALVGEAVPVAAPTAEQLAATFAKGKTFLAGAGPNGMGYKFPDRVKLDWIFIPSGDIGRSLVNDPALGPIELRKEFMRNPAAYGSAAPTPGAANAAPSFEEAKDRVREIVLRKLVKERGERIATFARDWSRSQVKDLPAESGIYKLPADWASKMPSLAVLSGEIGTRFSMPLPRVDTSGAGWLTPAEVDTNAFLGKAGTTEFGQPMKLSGLVKGLHEFDANSRIPAQAMLTGPVLTTPNDDIVIWRVTEAEPAHEPASMDEVRDAVLRDTISQLRYEALVKKSPEILAKANTEGLAAVAREYGATVELAPGIHLADPAVLKQFGVRFPGALPKAGQDVDAIRAVVSKAVSLPTDVPINSVPDAQKTLATEVPSKLVLLVVRITGLKPLTIEDFRDLEAAGSLRNAIAQDEPRIDIFQAFSLESLEKRQGYVRQNPQGPDRVHAGDAPAF